MSVLDGINSTSKSPETSATPIKNVEEEHSTIVQMAKLSASISTTTLSPSLMDKYTTTVTITSEISDEEQSTVATNTKTDSSIDSIKNNINEESIDVTTQSDELSTVNDVTTVGVDTVTQEQSEAVVISGVTSIAKPNDRSQVVSKDDIESIRGRALNFNKTDRKQQKSSGVIYVTAPSIESTSKHSKSFNDDLSDVNMDNDDMDFHSSEHMITTTTAQNPLIHDSELKGSMTTATIPTESTPIKATTDLEETASPSISNDYCFYKGKKYAINEKIEDGCESICKCKSSSATVECEPRCPKLNHTATSHEQCVSVPDPKDLCCHIELCDVTLDDHEQGSAISIVPAPPSFDGMKIKKGNHTTNLLSSYYKERSSAAAGTISSNVDAAPTAVAATTTVQNSNEKFDCEHNGNKYTIGTKKNNRSSLFIDFNFFS